MCPVLGSQDAVMNLFEVLEYGDIVASDEGTQRIVVWNTSVTLNMFVVEEGSYYNVDCCTLGKVSLTNAKKRATEWLKESSDV
jgi:hypothetical protein